jgi:hypothetical protein
MKIIGLTLETFAGKIHIKRWRQINLEGNSMAKYSSGRGGSNSRIRFVMVDAEIAEGEIGPIAAAIQNALRGTGSNANYRIAPPKLAPSNGNDAQAQDAEIEVEQPGEVLEEGIENKPRSTKVRRTVSRTPNVVPVDMNEEVSLASFAQGKDAKSQHKKYLIASAWLKEHRGIDAVTDDHIYTCFKSMGWSTSIPDFSQPLRDLKAKHRYYEKTDKGYEINHLGLDYVKKLGGGNGAG